MPGDDWFEKIDPMVWLWMYMSWIEDQTEKHNFMRDYVIFNGSFSNPEAAQKMRKHYEPDYELDDEEFEQSIDRVIKDRDKVIHWDKSKKPKDEETSQDPSKLRHISKRRRTKRVIK